MDSKTQHAGYNFEVVESEDGYAVTMVPIADPLSQLAGWEMSFRLIDSPTLEAAQDLADFLNDNLGETILQPVTSD